MGSVALEIFIAVDVVFLFLITVLGIFVWELMSNFKALRQENTTLLDRIRDLSIRLEQSIRNVDFYRSEAVGIAKDYQAHLAETKQLLTEIAAEIAHYKNENWELKRKLSQVESELAARMELTETLNEQLKRRVERTTGPLIGEK